MSKIRQYLIQLVPQGSFFFGSEKTFGQGDDTNYFVKSNYLPQQTALLGLLRYMVLEKEGRLNEPASGTQSLIGLRGFPAAGYGKIGGLSPLFIRYDEPGKPLKDYIVQAKDWGWQDEHRQTPVPLKRIEQKGAAHTVTGLDQLSLFKNYKAKNGLAHLLTEAEGSEWKIFDYDKEKPEDASNGIFVAHQKVGIQKIHAFQADGSKKERKENEEEAFYRQSLYKLLPHYSFAFFVSLETNSEGHPPIKEGLTVFGAEKSPFTVKITDARSDDLPGNLFEQLFANAFGNERRNQIILTSDACVDPELFNHSLFSINAQIDFRHIITPEGVKGNASYSALSSDNKQREKPHKSSKQNLIERGSVFYIKEEQMEAAKKALTNSVYQTIGYNQFISFP